MKNLIFIIGAVLLISSASLQAVPGDEHWDAQFGVAGFPGIGGNLYSVATHNGQIYASGLFTGSLTNAPIEVWNGAQWNVIGRAGASFQAVVYDMAFVGNNLYIAGSFTNVSGVAANGLAKWDGANWSSVGFSGTAFALAVSGNNLYVAGGFTNATADGPIATNIASWDGSAWHPLGGGLGTPSGTPQVASLAIQGGSVYAGGTFTKSGSLAMTNLAVWNGSTWSQVGGGINGTVYSLAFNSGNLIAGGLFSQAGTTPANGIAQWNGSTWSPFGTGVTSPGYAFRLAIFNNTIYAAGPFNSIGGVAATNVAYWTGSTWSPLGVGVSANVLRIISNVTNLYVGGAFGLAGGKIANSITSWDGANWSGIGSSGRMNGVNLSILALASDGTNLYAGGSFVGAGQTNADFLGRFDGTNWYSLGTGIGPFASTTVIRALAISTNGLYVGGEFSSAGGVSAANMALWNGTTWSALAGGPGGIVASILVRTDGVYAAGAPLNGPPQYSGSPFFERWDGTTWNNMLAVTNALFPVLIQTPNIAIDALASIGTNVFAGGQLWLSYYDPNNFMNITSCFDIFQESGSWVQPVGTGFNSNVLAMAVIGTNLYAGGYFTNAGGITANNIARWDGNNWWAVGSGVVGGGFVNALAVIGTNLYAGGTFTNMGGVTADGVARWDGNNWWSLGSGVFRGALPSTVLGLGSSGNNLYAGGPFQIAGNKQSFTVGHWNDQVNFNTPQLINPQWLPGEGFQTRLYGVPGVTNIIQVTTNLVDWTPVLTNSTGIYDFTDSNSPAYPYRFYRGVLSE